MGAAIDGLGRIVAVGAAGVNDPQKQIAVARYLSNGSLDSSFASGGRTLIPSVVPSDIATIIGNGTATDVALDNQGRLVISAFNDDDFIVLRLSQDGILDPTFNGDGIIVVDFNGSKDRANNLAIDSQGRIVVSGYIDNQAKVGFVRLTDTGEYDSDFAGTGKVEVDLSGTQQDIKEVVIGEADEIIAGGTTGVDFALVKLTSAGILDANFGFQGKVITDLGTSPEQIHALKIDLNGQYVVAGNRGSDATADVAVAMYIPSTGDLDSGFGIGGIVITDFDSRSDCAHDLVIDKGNKILITGTSSLSSCRGGDTNNSILARYLSKTF